MKRWISALLLGAAAALCACTDPSVTGSLVPAAVDEAQASQETVEFQEPMSSEEGDAFAQIEIEPVEAPRIETPSVETPVPIFTATPGPSESFAYSGDTISVRYYDMDTMQSRTQEYPVTDASDPQAVLDGVKAAYDSLLSGRSVRINSATFSDGNLFVDFDPSIYDLGIGSAGELQVLESVADTYLTNVDGIQAVFYTVNGEPYNSENISTNGSEAFKTLQSVRETD